MFNNNNNNNLSLIISSSHSSPIHLIHLCTIGTITIFTDIYSCILFSLFNIFFNSIHSTISNRNIFFNRLRLDRLGSIRNEMKMCFRSIVFNLVLVSKNIFMTFKTVYYAQ